MRNGQLHGRKLSDGVEAHRSEGMEHRACPLTPCIAGGLQSQPGMKWGFLAPLNHQHFAAHHFSSGRINASTSLAGMSQYIITKE